MVQATSFGKTQPIASSTVGIPKPGSSGITWNQRVFDLIAGSAVFVAVMLILSDTEPDFAYAILIAAFGTLLLTHADNITSLIGNFRSAIGKA
jgi:hypothetical protein